MNRIYLDHNATSPLRPEVKESIQRFLAESGANPSSIHSSGRKARRAMDEAREEVAKLLGADAGEIVFTSGGTEANHLAWRSFGRPGVRAATTAVEHSCVLDAAAHARSAGAEVIMISVGSHGHLSEPDLNKVFSSPLHFLSVQAANNETGVIYPIEKLTMHAKEQGAAVHTDAVQVIGKKPVNVREWGVDFLTLSGHKVGAPAGVGALYIKKGSPLDPLWGRFGTQEKGRRPGTENLLGIVGLGAACKTVREKGAAESQRISNLRDAFEKELTNKIPGCVVSAQTEARLPNTSHMTFEDAAAESLVIAADLEGLDCSTGAACSSGSVKPSHVLLAMGFSELRARGSIRFSLGWSTTELEIAKAVELFPKVVAQVRSNRRIVVEKARK